MLHVTTNAAEKRLRLREGLASGRLLQFPGAFNPLAAMLIEQKGFDGVYISGAVLSAELGLPDIGLTSLTEVSQRGYQMARATNLPCLIDIDTGFGEPMSAYRTVHELEDLGLAACHLEDQINPKRCGHLDNKALVSCEDMVRKVRAAVEARRDPNFVLIARTDARGVEGFDAAVTRAKRYVEAGADVIFAEALTTLEEFREFRRQVGAPLLANMTEFGKSKLFTADELSSAGMSIVIYPVTLLRLAMGAAERGLDILKATGTQEGAVSEMQTRKRLYEVLNYEGYNQFDTSLFNFTIEEGQKS